MVKFGQKCIVWCSDKLARNWLIFTNFLLFVFGVVITIFAIIGVAQTDELQKRVVILEWFNLLLLAWTVVITGILLTFTAAAGFWGALFPRGDYAILFLKVYTFILFLVFCLELGVGIYLSSLNVDVLKSFWFEDTSQGYQRRESYQDYFDCCGWETLTDSYPFPGGGLGPECHNFAIDLTCRQATQDWLDTYITPITLTVIIIPVVEFISLVCSCIIISNFSDKSAGDDDDDDFFH